MPHIVVVTKSAPDKEAKISVNAAGAVQALASGGDAPMVINSWDEYTVTEALILKEAHGVKTTVMAVGPDIQNEALKQALAMGIDEAMRVWDDSMEGQDTLGYSTAVAAAIQKLGDVDLVLFGKEFMDLGTDAHIFQVGRKLGWPVLGSYLKILSVDFGSKAITLERLVEEGKLTLTGKLPAVISVAQDINEPRYASFMGIRKASRTVIPVWSSADLSLGETASGNANAASVKTTGYSNIPAWKGTVEMIEGGSDQEKTEKLVAKLSEDKLL